MLRQVWFFQHVVNKFALHSKYSKQGFKMRFRSWLRFQSRYGKISLMRQSRSMLWAKMQSG